MPENLPRFKLTDHRRAPELPRLMHDLVHRGVEAGHGDDQLTALVKVLGEP